MMICMHQGRHVSIWRPGTLVKEIMIKLYNTKHNVFVPTISNFMNLSRNLKAGIFL